MTVLAKIQPKRINLVELIKRSILSNEEKQQWLDSLPLMSMPQKSDLAKMLLDAEDQIVANADQIVNEIHTSERVWYRKEEDKAAQKDDEAAQEILNTL